MRRANASVKATWSTTAIRSFTEAVKPVAETAYIAPPSGWFLEKEIPMRQKVFALIDETLAALKAAGTLKLEQMPGYTVEPPKNAAHGDWAVNVAMVLNKPRASRPGHRQRDREGAGGHGGHRRQGGGGGPGLPELHAQANGDPAGGARGAAGRRGVRAAGAQVDGQADAWWSSCRRTRRARCTSATRAARSWATRSSRLLDAAGHDVTREFYINDYGKQVETLGRTVHKRYRQLFGEQVSWPRASTPPSTSSTSRRRGRPRWATST